MLCAGPKECDQGLILHGIYVWLLRRFRAISNSFEKRTIDVEGMSTGYLTAGAGTPLLLLHGVGTSAREWSWVLPALACDHLVYAVNLPGYDGSVAPSDYAPVFT